MVSSASLINPTVKENLQFKCVTDNLVRPSKERINHVGILIRSVNARKVKVFVQGRHRTQECTSDGSFFPMRCFNAAFGGLLPRPVTSGWLINGNSSSTNGRTTRPNNFSQDTSRKTIFLLALK